MLKGKKVIVTAGGTQEYIDDVRVMTNISTGRTGHTIASKLLEMGCLVTYIRSTTAPSFTGTAGILDYPIVTAQNALEALRNTMQTPVDAVVHCMAVSDFTFERSTRLKIKSSSTEDFIEHLRKTIKLNPKIISHIKQWQPQTHLIGFKFEVGVTEETITAISRESIERNGCDLIIANDKIAMDALGEHVAKFVHSDAIKQKYGLCDCGVIGNQQIALSICNFLSLVLE